ncbi:MAG: hypothetical protein JSW65_00475, partial [Candidatus Bipolaricaulota bacterium]
MADNTTWLVLGGMALGLILLMLFSTPTEPIADAAQGSDLAADSAEIIVGEARGEAAAVVSASVPAQPVVSQPMAVYAPIVGEPCGCDPAPIIPHDCPVPHPCGCEPAPVGPHRCPAPDPCPVTVVRPVCVVEDPCAPQEHPCDDPCTPHVRPPDPYVPRACDCEPCWTHTDPEWPCDRPSCEPIVRTPHPFWPEDERECRVGSPP